MKNSTTAYRSLIESEIRRLKFGSRPASLYEPIRYIMGLGGKRLRPLLVLLAYSLFKRDVKNVVRFAVAVEAFHNFTLMHDDIMDNAPLRRGKATVHRKWNVNTAILSGDVMLVHVYNLFLSLPSKKLNKVLALFNQCAAEVCEGQQWDMEFETMQNVTEKQYLQMIRQKTAVLLGFSLELGGILAEATPANCKALRDFGTNIGLGFQLMDDLLDAYGDPEKFGKQPGGDIIANKKTYLMIKALQAANAEQRNELDNWLSVVNFNPSEKVDAVKTIWDQLLIRQETEKKISSYFRKGFRSLDKVRANKAAIETLRKFAEDLIARQH
ncbi:MAG: polyprenyl synthetase family protein [Flammeovirgaceae bacterium]|nr:MAG: polyprenyl synthetase family protein [Flammeovirgaceae bacterium]